MKPAKPLALVFGPWRALVAPQFGGALIALEREGYGLLPEEARRGPESGEVRSACFPMVPYCNRIGLGRFSYQGRSYALEREPRGGLHSLHGIGWRRAWTIREADEASCVLQLVHRPGGDAGGGADWPFAFTARQTFRLGSDGLCVTLALTNDDGRHAPAGLGLHPYFRRRPGESIRFLADFAWDNDETMLPAEPVLGARFNYGTGRELNEDLVDHDFSGWRGWAKFEAPGEPTITLKADAIYRTLRVYSPPDSGLFAVEPMTHETNALNRLAKVPPMTDLGPGATLTGRIWMGLEPAG